MGVCTAMKGMKPVKTTIVEKQVIPKLSDHSRVVSGVPGPASKGHSAGRRAVEAGLVNLAIEDTQRHLEKQYDVQGLVFPHTRLLKLPIEPEPAPSLRPGPLAKEWGNTSTVTREDGSEAVRILRGQYIIDEAGKITAVQSPVQAPQSLRLALEALGIEGESA